MIETLKYFKPSEFSCPDGTYGCMNEEFLLRLEEARELAGVSFVVHKDRGGSAFRTPEHNAAVGGVSDSAHTKGLAVDIATTNSVSRFRIVKALLDVGFTRIGIAKTFVHVDADTTKPEGVIWLY